VLSQKLNREPVLAEIAKESGFPETKVRDLLALIENPISLEAPVVHGRAHGLTPDRAERSPNRKDLDPSLSVGLDQFGADRLERGKPHACRQNVELEPGLRAPGRNVGGGDEDDVGPERVDHGGGLVDRLGAADHLDEIALDPLDEPSGNGRASDDE
jgi:Sigma-70 region 3